LANIAFFSLLSPPPPSTPLMDVVGRIPTLHLNLKSVCLDNTHHPRNDDDGANTDAIWAHGLIPGHDNATASTDRNRNGCCCCHCRFSSATNSNSRRLDARELHAPTARPPPPPCGAETTTASQCAMPVVSTTSCIT